MKRLLCIVGSMNAGGAETFLMKVYRKLNRTMYQMDFAIGTPEEGFYDQEITELGGRIFHIAPKSEGLLKNFFEIKKLVKTEQYKYVFRTSQNSLSALELFAAKLGGAEKRIYRSSNSNITDSKREMIVHKMCFLMPKLFANVRFAPSTEAAEFVFGKRCIDKGRASIIHNGIDLNTFRFNAEDRNTVRKELDIEDRFVVGHVGRFYVQKNHKKLVEIFYQIQKRIPNAILILVGQGELKKEIETQLIQLGLQDNVIFTGVRKDVSRLLSAMDVFVFPSLYEGMPNTVIEAQATGLPCVISNTITKEAKVTDIITYMGLEDDSAIWAEEAIKMSMLCQDRMHPNAVMKGQGYDIEDCVKQFVDAVF